MLNIITYKWKKDGYRSKFEGWHVNALFEQCKLHVHVPFKFWLVTDDPTGVDPAISVIPLWANPAPHYAVGEFDRPNCFYRLKMFSKEFQDLMDGPIMSLDLDTVITGDITHLITQDEFTIWCPDGERMPCNGSLVYFHNTERTKKLWEKFDPSRIDPDYSLRREEGKFVGSDQAWIATNLLPEDKFYGIKDGVYSFRCHLLPKGGRLPHDAKIVFFHGKYDPWDEALWKKYPWIKTHYLTLNKGEQSGHDFSRQ